MKVDILMLSKVLSSEIRIKILSYLCQEDLYLSEIASKLPSETRDRQGLHRHLEVLTKSGLISKYYEKKGRNIIKYRMNCENISIDLCTGTVTVGKVPHLYSSEK